MKITKRQLKRIIKEERAKMLKEYTSDADAAYEAGHDDAIRNRPHGSNPDMRDLDPSAYDHGFDKGTAERMDMQRPSGTRGFYESELKEDSEMKITKRQLQKIVKEEKQKLLVEMNPMADAKRSLSSYANVSTVDKLTDAILDLLQEVSFGAEEDGLEEDESEDMATAAALLAVAQAFQSAGLVGEYDAMFRMITNMREPRR